MLVLSRKPGERILIGDNVKITVVRIGPNTVRLGIDAPRDVPVVREEIDRVGSTPVGEPEGVSPRTVEVEIDLDLVGQLLTGVLDHAPEPIVDLRTLEMPARPQRAALKKRLRSAHLRELVQL